MSLRYSGAPIATSGWAAGPVASATSFDRDASAEVRDLFESLEIATTADLIPFFTSKFVRATSKDVRDCRLGREGDTLLHCACKVGNRRIARLLIDSGCDMDAISSPLTLTTPLMAAITRGNVDIVFDLIAAGARLDRQDFSGDNIFHHLARAGSAKVLKQVVASAQISGRVAQALASQENYHGKKRKLPENVAANELLATILRSYRETGDYQPPERARDQGKKNPLLVLRRRVRVD